MADIKAAFFDIDGTLLPFEAKHLPASTVDALARLRRDRAAAMERQVEDFYQTSKYLLHHNGKDALAQAAP